MKASELFEIKTNTLRPRMQQVKKYVDPGTKGAIEESEYDYQARGYVKTGKWYVWRDEPMKDDEGKVIMHKPYSRAHWAAPSGKEITSDRRAAVYGTVGEWLDLMGATRADLPKALELVRKSPEYAEALAIGFEEIGNPAMEKNGTIDFKVKKGYFIGDENERGAPDLGEIFRRVLANGTIRGMTRQQSYHGWRVSVPHPMTIKTHPNLTPVERIAGTMRQSIAAMVKLDKPKLDRALKKRLIRSEK